MCHTSTPFPISSDHAKVELESIGQGCDALCTAGILGHDYRFPPIGHVVTDPTSNEGFRMEIIDRAFEEALHLGGMEVDGDDVLDTSNAKQIGQ